MSNCRSFKSHRRSALLAAGQVALAGVISGCGWMQSKAVTVAAHVWVGYEPLFMASGRGWLDTSKVTLLQTASSVESITALRSGKALAAALTLDEMLSARASGLPLAAVLVFNVSMGADMLLARPQYTHLADLKGLRIGFEASSVGEVMLAEGLRLAGLSRKDVQLVNIPVERQVQAWTQQLLDAVVTYEPVASQLRALGARRLFDSRQIPNTIVDVLAVRTDALESGHDGPLRQLLKAHFRALDHLMRSPQDAAYRMADHLKLPASEVLAAYKGLLLPDVSNNRRLLGGLQPELIVTARRISDILLSAGVLQQADLLLGLTQPRFLPPDPSP